MRSFRTPEGIMENRRRKTDHPKTGDFLTGGREATKIQEGGNELNRRQRKKQSTRTFLAFVSFRSEERRVGKECRSRWWRDQAEDGIRDLTVTGVQTCALPIYEKF